MSILARLALLFVVVPLVELALLVRVGQLVGFWPTMGLVLLTGAAGALLARAEGFRTLWTLRSELARGRIPHQAMMDGVSILVGGALLLTPGFLTDAAGFALLLPPTRRWVQRRVRRRLERRIATGEIRVEVASSRPVPREEPEMEGPLREEPEMEGPPWGHREAEAPRRRDEGFLGEEER